MARGRKRKHDPSIPAHINQNTLPPGIYWNRKGRGRWFVFERGPHGKLRRKTVATRDARMSDLHQIAEAREGIDRATLSWLLDEFAKSTQYRELASGTRKQYDGCSRTAKTIVTKFGQPLGDVHVSRLSAPAIQRIVDSLAANGTPTKANALLRYLRRVFRWGVNRGLCESNPAKGVEQAKERRALRMPSPETMAAVRDFAKARAELKAHTEGSVAPYLWICIELAYLLRLRSAELLLLSDACAKPEGILVHRLKGSRANLVEWTSRLRAVWDAALDLRKRSTRKGAITQLDPARRPLIVAQGGGKLSIDGLGTAWQRMIHAAIDAGAITADQRFGLHGLKHRGITDTAGNRAEKQDASGHKSAAMLDVYDHSVPVVKPAGSE
jgi:site-specific recombinase XerC